ncbi:heat shock 70 kDa protein 12B-like [Dreissena polymorpha]|uniref:heat shock 70 kDa protein 12B-like n=1 Tax=Dreissena polymorpha TaxID=45954 RepID=UPI0022654E43|nr:heat shock 70 kDa protein 12B-like [Dreissena polymorpha]
MSTSRKDFLVVAAIDFGTAYSGYAFSSIQEFKSEPLKISANTWIGGSLMSQKTSTCVLFDKDKTFNFKKFGFDAEDAYADFAMDDNHKDYYYYRRFKMELFNKLMLAMDVFSACIKFLKDDCIGKIRLQLPEIRDTDIRWVLTVPAIWNVSKQFMRESAAKAGIPNESLLIALEPEAASLCCRHSPMTSLKGGTIDITVHEVMPGGGFKV